MVEVKKKLKITTPVPSVKASLPSVKGGSIENPTPLELTIVVIVGIITISFIREKLRSYLLGNRRGSRRREMQYLQYLPTNTHAEIIDYVTNIVNRIPRGQEQLYINALINEIRNIPISTEIPNALPITEEEAEDILNDFSEGLNSRGVTTGEANLENIIEE